MPERLIGPDAIRLIRLYVGVRQRHTSVVIVGSNPTLFTLGTHQTGYGMGAGKASDIRAQGPTRRDTPSPCGCAAPAVGKSSYLSMLRIPAGMGEAMTLARGQCGRAGSIPAMDAAGDHRNPYPVAGEANSGEQSA